MTLEPFFEASLPIKIHMIAAIGAFVLGAVVLWKKKGGKTHKFNGRIWVALMMVTALSGFFIHEIKMIGHFSPIHLFSVLTPISLIYAIMQVRKGDIKGHVQTMRATYVGGMLFAGGFTFFPGRLNYQIFFGQTDLGPRMMSLSILLAFAGAALIALYYRQKEQISPQND